MILECNINATKTYIKIRHIIVAQALRSCQLVPTKQTKWEGLSNDYVHSHGACDPCAKGKQVRFSFISKKRVSRQSPLKLINMDLCGPVRIQSRSDKRYVLVIADDFSRYNWVIFLHSKDETFDEFVTFLKKVQRISGFKLKHLRPYHGTEFENSKFDDF